MGVPIKRSLKSFCLVWLLYKTFSLRHFWVQGVDLFGTFSRFLTLTEMLSGNLEDALFGVQFSVVAQSCLTLCNPMDCSTPGFPVHHQLPELTQTHVHPVGDAMQPLHPLSPPSSPAFNLSQHQGLFNESVLRIRWPRLSEHQLRHQSFQWIFRTDLL